jgi:hypothetical protein
MAKIVVVVVSVGSMIIGTSASVSAQDYYQSHHNDRRY